MTGKVLVTGITGNVGSEVAGALVNAQYPFVAGVRDVTKARREVGSRYEFVAVDFENPSTYQAAFAGVEKLFLVRPPALADFTRQLKPVLDFSKEAGIRQIVFLSLMGIERNPLPPHYKVEKYIQSLHIPYTFLRPSFFMQSVNQAHCADIKECQDIFIPAGKAKVSLIDVRDIGEIGAKALMESGHENKAYTLTGKEALDYNQVAEIFSRVLARKINYSNPSLLRFRSRMLQRGVDKKYVHVMIALYLTTRMGMAKAVTPAVEGLLGRPPRSVIDYVTDYAKYWEA